MNDIPDSALPQGNIPPPSTMASLGLGMTDVYGRLYSSLLSMLNPAAARRYDAQRALDAAIYRRGLLNANPTDDSPQVSPYASLFGPGTLPPQSQPLVGDTARTLGEMATVGAPFAILGPAAALENTPEAFMGQAGTMHLLQAIQRAAPWLVPMAGPLPPIQP